MTKKDYELIAEVLRYWQPDRAWLDKHVQWRYVVHSMAETLEKNNLRFDRKKFLTACGITD